MILSLIASLAIVAQDHVALRSSPRSNGRELALLWPGDVVEVRGHDAEFLKVYDYRHERGGYVREGAARAVDVSAAGAPELRTILRFLRDTPGNEALGISYGAAYIKAAPASNLDAEPFDAIARMAERLGEQASGNAGRLPAAEYLEVVRQFGIHMRTLERDGRIQVCYDGDMFRRLLTQDRASAEQRANAVLGLTRADCIDPDLTPLARNTLDAERRNLLETTDDSELSPMTRSRLHARRAAVWASVAFERARHGEQPGAEAARAVRELLAVHVNDFGESRRGEYLDAVLRVSAIRWAMDAPPTQQGPLSLSAIPGDAGQTCVSLRDARRPEVASLVQRCTYGIVWMASAHAITQAPAFVVSVQPLDGWRELWVFRAKAGTWTIDVLSPGLEQPDAGFVDFAGFAPTSRRLLIAREVREHGRFRRWFEELRLEDLAVERQASSPDALRDFSRWQDAAWRRDTLSLY